MVLGPPFEALRSVLEGDAAFFDWFPVVSRFNNPHGHICWGSLPGEFTVFLAASKKHKVLAALAAP